MNRERLSSRLGFILPSAGCAIGCGNVWKFPWMAGQKWHTHGYFALFGNICLMSFYTVVSGWIMYYFYKFVMGQSADLGFVSMISNPGVNMIFMVFASMSTVLAVFENILACVREMTGRSRPKGSIVCAIGILITSTTTALGYSVFKFQPFAEGSAWLDLWDFIVSNNLLPLGSLLFVIFCYIVPIAIVVIYIVGLVNFSWK